MRAAGARALDSVADARNGTPGPSAADARRRSSPQPGLPDEGRDPIKGSTLGHEWKRVLARAFDRHAKVTITTAKGNTYTPVRPLVDVRFHDLRHTAATLMRLVGVHPKVVSERLGHATIAMMLDTYSHVLPSLQSDTTLAIERYLAVLRLRAYRPRVGFGTSCGGSTPRRICGSYVSRQTITRARAA